MNKKQRHKSLSLFETKLSSKNSINKRNLLHSNNSNKSYNNNKNISKITNNNNISKNNKNSNKLKMNYKYKTIANVCNSSSSKRTKNDSSMRINNNYKNKSSYYSNYHSINSFRGKKIDKSDSRSRISRSKGISKSCLPEESNNSKNHLVNSNKNCINSTQNKNESENLLSNKNKIMINYNTNIINTNVSIDKVTIKQKMKDIRKDFDEKINEITRNKKNKIHRTISEICDKRRNTPFFNDKIRTKRESSFRYNRISKEKHYSHKLGIKTKKNNRYNKYNSNAFRKKVHNFTIQHKNKNKKMQKSKTKHKNKSNSMFNIKNKSNEEINNNNNKAFSIQAYSCKKIDGHINLYNFSDNKMNNTKKNNSLLNLNSKIVSNKNSNLKNKDKTILDNNYNHHVVMTHRKKNYYNKISLYNEKMSKNSSKSKQKSYNLNSNSNNNKMNSSLCKFILNKCMPNPNIV